MKKQLDYQNDYIREHYDRITLTVPKGTAVIYREFAAIQGKKLNTVINELLSDWLKTCQEQS